MAEKKEVLAIRAVYAAIVNAFPGEHEFVRRMIIEGKTLEEARKEFEPIAARRNAEFKQFERDFMARVSADLARSRLSTAIVCARIESQDVPKADCEADQKRHVHDRKLRRKYKCQKNVFLAYKAERENHAEE